LNSKVLFRVIFARSATGYRRSRRSSSRGALFGDLSGGGGRLSVVRSTGMTSTVEPVDNPVDEFGQFVRKPYFTT
jgi:hypothetical protein